MEERVVMGNIAIKARPLPGEGRWGQGIFPNATDKLIEQANGRPLSSFEHDAVRAGLVATLMDAELADGIGAALGYVLHQLDQHPHVVKRILGAEVQRGGIRCRLIDALNKGVR